MARSPMRASNRMRHLRWPASRKCPASELRDTWQHELRKQRGTSKYMVLTPLFDLKFLNELAAGGVGTSNRAALAASSIDPRQRIGRDAERARMASLVGRGAPEQLGKSV